MNSSDLPAQFKIGILGGGQLARMMALKGHELGMSIHVLSQNANDPAAQVTRHWTQGSVNSEADLNHFFSQVNIVIFESEFLNSQLISKVAQQQKVRVFPDPQLMGQLQDRLTQKQWLFTHQIPTARFLPIDNFSAAESALNSFHHGMVLKKRRYGYDGYGTYVIRNRSQLKKISEVMAKEKEGFIAEELVPFRRELTLLAARNQGGDTVFLPLVETRQENSRCQWVMGPVKHAKLAILKIKVKKALERSAYVGVIAFELFDVKQTLLVNEIAPRVHNSGHFSLDALSADQFSLHLKAVSGQKLATPKSVAKGFAMYNLLGESTSVPQWTLPSEAKLHWYGKIENRPGRKMGHLNAIAISPKRALSKVMKAKKGFKL